MAKWLDKLKHIIKVELKINAPIFQININRSGDKYKKGYRYDEHKKILHVNPDQLPPHQKKIIKNAVKGYIQTGHKLLEHETSNLLEELYNYEKSNPDKSIIAFFDPIIPHADLEALEASLFLRNQFNSGHNVAHLKQNIRSRFGDRGNNISNLCTAGYFEKFLIPLYNDINSPEEFGKVYEEIVSKSMLAIFVHAKTKVESIPGEISNRIILSKKFGIKFIHIHGISKKNVKKIKSYIEEHKEYFDFFDKRIYENKEKNLIIVELFLK